MAYYQYMGNCEVEKDIAQVGAYIQTHRINMSGLIEARAYGKQWQESSLGRWLMNEAQQGDSLITYSALTLVDSVASLCQMLALTESKGVDMHFAKYDMVFCAAMKRADLLILVAQADRDYIDERKQKALLRRQVEGLPFGRPKGSPNKGLKLDKHGQDIIRYLELGLSKSSIAKLLGTHAQTLHDWMLRHGVSQTKTTDSHGKTVYTVVNRDLRHFFNVTKSNSIDKVMIAA